ncbi:C4-dicarboxylate ABC transporter permease [Rhodothalassium salexigens]|uniref:TRAP transporter large permease n=1 Tax=Rhodothalassium salexigens TaxID=1086 RepID=UPI0019123732|nr:TRAP transporter large permease [Rhodothalassium salexigens]MBK5912220.1 C4-dicarboxylate ABC transporter permease [Rhodothalassium salexigens]
MSLAYFWVFVFLLCAGMPVVFALLVGPGLSLALDGQEAFHRALLSRLYNGLDSFPLMAVPFFILAGEVMNASGVTRTLVDLSRTLIGHVRGGLAQMNVLSSILFAGLSGSAVADTSALGKMFVPAMVQAGYSARFAAAVTAASSVIGPIIPPSGIMILYAFVMNVSVAGLFAAGIVPGLLITLALFAVVAGLARRRGFARDAAPAGWPARARAVRRSLPALLTPVILLGGILGGVMTPTEAAAVAAAYALALGLIVRRSLKPGDLARVFTTAAVQSGVILLLVGAAVSFAWMVSVSGLATDVTTAIRATTDNVLLLLLLVNLFLLLVGMVLDAGPAILILGPVLGPVFTELGVDPLHFAVVMCVNVTIGLATPPMGLVLFVAASVSGERVEALARELLPFLAAEIAVIALVTFVPALSLTLPRLLGFA